MKLPIGLFAIIFALCTGFSAHKYYISITEIHYNTENSNLELSTRVFYDDLSTVIYAIEGKRLTSDAEADAELISKYLENNVSLSVNGEKLQAHYLGADLEGDALWCYLEFHNPHGEIKNLNVRNSVLTELFEDQSNIINFFPQKGKNKVKGLALSRKKQQGSIKLK